MGMRFAEIQEVEGAEVVPVKLEQRVHALINSPVAHLGRRVRIHRLETDSDQAWGAVMDTLAATNGLHMQFDDAGAVILQWESTGAMTFAQGCTTADRSNDEAPF